LIFVGSVTLTDSLDVFWRQCLLECVYNAWLILTHSDEKGWSMLLQLKTQVNTAAKIAFYSTLSIDTISRKGSVVQ